MWVLLGILSAFFLGLYDVFRKASLNHNAVLPVLFLSCLSGAIVFVPFFLISRLVPSFQGAIWFVPKVTAFTHLLIIHLNIFLLRLLLR
jgi:transporter family protein